jgi:hypothetical protein
MAAQDFTMPATTTEAPVTKPEQAYFSVGCNGKWTTASAPASFFTNRGAAAGAKIQILPSRRHPEESGIMTLWINGYNMGYLFPKREDQIAYLIDQGLLDADDDELPMKE